MHILTVLINYLVDSMTNIRPDRTEQKACSIRVKFEKTSGIFRLELMERDHREHVSDYFRNCLNPCI